MREQTEIDLALVRRPQEVVAECLAASLVADPLTWMDDSLVAAIGKRARRMRCCAALFEGVLARIIARQAVGPLVGIRRHTLLDRCAGRFERFPFLLGRCVLGDDRDVFAIR